MRAHTHLHFERRPSDFGLFLTIIRHGRTGKRNPDDALALRASWHDIAIDRDHLHAFHAACGLDVQAGASILYPMTLAYPLILRLLSGPVAPMPLFRALNTRMLMQQHRPLHADDRPSIDVHVVDVRRVQKGLELDLQVRMQVKGRPVWDCFMTFFYRGRFMGVARELLLTSDLRVTHPEESATWTLPASGAMRFGRLSGDTNPIHYGKYYAKAFGFERDFAQPLLILGQALSRLPAMPADRGQRLEARLKGPVYYERTLNMLREKTMQGMNFEVYCEPNPKPSICAQLSVLT